MLYKNRRRAIATSQNFLKGRRVYLATGSLLVPLRGVAATNDEQVFSFKSPALVRNKAQQERWTGDSKDVNEESNLSLYGERIVGMHALLSFFPKFPLLVSETDMIKRRWSSLARHGMYAGAVQTRCVVP